MRASITSLLVLPEESPAQTSITPTATMSGHQNPGNVVVGTAIENPIDPIDKAISTAEGYSHDTIPSFASTLALPGFLPAATEPSAFPEPASVDDFLFELDGGIEPTLKPPLPDDIPSTTAVSPTHHTRYRSSLKFKPALHLLSGTY